MRAHSPFCHSLVIVLLVAGAGCQIGPKMPVVNAPEAVTSAVGDPVAFRTNELPLNESPSSNGGSLTLSDAVGLAVRYDPKIQAAFAEVRGAQADAQQTRLLPNPVLNVGVRLRSGSSSIIDLSLGEELTSFLSRPSRIAAADFRMRAASASALTEALDVVSEVQEHYVAAQTAEQIILLLEERRGLTGRLFSVSESRLEAGEGTRSDVLAVQLKQGEVEIEIAEQRRASLRERLAVARLIGRPSDAATWKLSSITDLPDLAATETSWVDAALENRPEVAALSWELSALGYDRRAARLLPFDGLDAGADSERDQEWSVGPAASVPLPIFDWGQASRAAVEARIVQTKHRLVEAKRQVVQEVRQAFTDYRESAATLKRVRTDLVSLAVRRREQAEAAYESGLVDLTDVLLADEELQTAKVKAVELSRDLNESRIHLERAAGGAARAPAATTAPTTETTTTGATP